MSLHLGVKDEDTTILRNLANYSTNNSDTSHIQSGQYFLPVCYAMLTNIGGPYWLLATEILKTYSFSFNGAVTDTERKNSRKINQTATQQMTIGKICSPDGKVNWP
jgi:hypothetical protein